MASKWALSDTSLAISTPRHSPVLQPVDFLRRHRDQTFDRVLIREVITALDGIEDVSFRRIAAV
jgi:hypothetical protein